jgi:methyl-accepting chemotaxis protein
MILRRMVGVIIVLIALSGIGMAVAGTPYVHRMIDETVRSLSVSLDLASQSLDAAEETLLLAKATLVEVNDGLEKVETTIVDVSQTISRTQPLLQDMTQVAGHDVPDGLDAFQATLPDIAQAAATIDATLMMLNDLRLEQQILGFPIRLQFDLNYAPEVSFEDSISQIGKSLEGVSPRLRALASHVDGMDEALELTKEDLVAASSDLGRINASIADALPLLDEYVRIVTRVRELIQHTRTTVPKHARTAKLGVTVVALWLGLAQIAPLHYGWGLVTGRRGGR